ncbi:Oxysterol-binding protein 1 [Chionoecetes opilio]|uniref:Oxysterol-binding protein 1 n=1 Tax=Chionoecetes opilio TaxID=41210 RepID=A0A8J4XKX3_CHIOP|nr:Oxysterol-binding protein 1 [Chionoecetes opilio]
MPSNALYLLLLCCRSEEEEEEEEGRLVMYLVPRVDHLLLAEDEDEEDVGDAGADDVANTLKVLTAKLEDLRTCHDLILKHGAALQKSLSELEALDTSTQDLNAKTKTVNERATLFRISSNAMINVCNGGGAVDAVTLSYERRGCGCWGRSRREIFTRGDRQGDAVRHTCTQAVVVKVGHLGRKDGDTPVRVRCLAGGTPVLTTDMPLGDLLRGLKTTTVGDPAVLIFSVEEGKLQATAGQEQTFAALFCNAPSTVRETPPSSGDCPAEVLPRPGHEYFLDEEIKHEIGDGYPPGIKQEDVGIITCCDYLLNLTLRCGPCLEAAKDPRYSVRGYLKWLDRRYSYCGEVQNPRQEEDDEYSPQIDEEERNSDGEYFPQIDEEERNSDGEYSPQIDEEERNSDGEYSPQIDEEERNSDDEYSPQINLFYYNLFYKF